MQLRIPLLKRGRVSHASSADSSPRRTTFYRHSNRERFENPLPCEARIAILAPNFLERQGVRCFEADELAEVTAFQPEILGGTAQTLLRVAPAVRVTRAVVAFSGARIGPLTRKDRDLLWTAFQVPLFEQCVGVDGSVVARECEAHDGLHVSEVYSGTGALRNDLCACGRTAPRLESGLL